MLIGFKDTVRRRPKNPKNTVALDFSGSAGVGSSLSLKDQSTQIVAPVGLYDAMGIPPCAETRSESYDQGRVVHSRADILFCQNCIHKHVGLEDSLGRGRRVYENRYALFLPDLRDLIQGLNCTASTPSTLQFPSCSASLKLTMRLTVSGLSISVMRSLRNPEL